VAKGLARVANALAIGIGAGMEGYGKGTLASLMQQREDALAEVRERRADARAQQQMDFSAGESEKDREFRRESAQESMAWEKEKFGMQQAAEEQKFGRSLAAQKQLAAMKGTAEQQDPAAIQELKFYIDVSRKKNGREVANYEDELWAIEQVKGRGGTGSAADGRTSTMKEAQELARLEELSASGDPAAQRELRAYHQRLGLGEFAKKSQEGLSLPQWLDTRNKLLEAKVGFRPATDEDIAWADAEMERMGSPRPGGASSPTEKMPAPPAAVSTQSHLAGAGTEDDPYVATTADELESLYNRLPPGTFVRYRNQLLEK
jgi:hypothetical protein